MSSSLPLRTHALHNFSLSLSSLSLSHTLTLFSPPPLFNNHRYLAPELVQCDRGQLQGYDKAIDMWGVGLLAFIMLYGFNPFARDTQV